MGLDLWIVRAKNIQKQKSLVFCLKALFLSKNVFFFYFSPIAKFWWSKKLFRKFQKKTPVLASLFNKVAGVLLWNLQNFQEQLFSITSANDWFYDSKIPIQIFFGFA